MTTITGSRQKLLSLLRWLKSTGLLLLLVLCVPAALVLYAADNNADEKVHRTSQQLGVAGCERSNVMRAYGLASARPADEALAQATLAIVNCKASVKAGRTVLVAKRVQREYVCMVAIHHVWPVVNYDGEIESSRKLPSASQQP